MSNTINLVPTGTHIYVRTWQRSKQRSFVPLGITFHQQDKTYFRTPSVGNKLKIVPHSVQGRGIKCIITDINQYNRPYWINEMPVTKEGVKFRLKHIFKFSRLSMRSDLKSENLSFTIRHLPLAMKFYIRDCRTQCSQYVHASTRRFRAEIEFDVPKYILFSKRTSVRAGYSNSFSSANFNASQFIPRYRVKVSSGFGSKQK